MDDDSVEALEYILESTGGAVTADIELGADAFSDFISSDAGGKSDTDDVIGLTLTTTGSPTITAESFNLAKTRTGGVVTAAVSDTAANIVDNHTLNASADDEVG